ncbi:MAG: Transposase [Actinomycetota bacterium]|nr:Transposase [Actinomycetota bacterium]
MSQERVWDPRVEDPQGLAGRDLDSDITRRNQLLTALRAIGERGNAILKTRWAVLQRINLCPNE